MKINFTIILILLFLTKAIYSQQDYLMSYKLENLSLLNPAYKPLHDRQSYIFQHRSQWIGFDGAPTTDLVSYNSKTMFKSIAYGVSLISDKIGYINNYKIHGNFSYQIKLKSRHKIVFGLKPGINILSNNLASIKLTNPNDASYIVDKKTVLTPNVGFGIFYYSVKKYVGFSATNIIARKKGVNQIQNHYYLIGGTTYRLNFDERKMFEPEGVLRFTKGSPIELDLNLNFKLEYKYIVGLLIKTGGDIGINLGAEVLNNFTVLYSFGYSYSTKTFVNEYGNHEIMLRYLVPGLTINKNKRRTRIGKGNKVG